MDVYLETDRLVLREFTPDDVEHLLALDADPEVMRFLTGGRPTPREEIVDQVLPRFLWYRQTSPGFGYFAAIEKATGTFIGWFHLRPGAGLDDEPELGYRLVRSAWGKGYATEGSRALIDEAFTELGARRVYAETMAINVASRRVMEKSGMRYVRGFHGEWPDRIPGDGLGEVEYEITREDWERSRSES